MPYIKYRIMRYLLLLAFFYVNTISAQPDVNGPYESGYTTVNLSRDGRSFNALIYYPSPDGGEDAAIEANNGPYPIISFGHGFFMQNRYYSSLFAHLASHGYVVIAPQFPDVNHLQLAYDLLYCLDYIKEQHGDPASMFYGLIDIIKTGLSGHSMGGGASLLAASADERITVVVPLAAAETNPSAIDAMNKIKAVVYLISAEDDGITPLSTNQLPMYENALPVKGIPIIKGANHTKFLDTRLFDFTDPNGYLSAAKQLEITRKYLTFVFNLFLKQDTAYFSFTFGNRAQNDEEISIDFHLKPLKPLSFLLIQPGNTINDSIVDFKWNSANSLNLYDKIEYLLEISTNPDFSQYYHISEIITDTTYSQILENGSYFWRVKAFTSDSTWTLSDTKVFNVDMTTGLNSTGFIYDQLKLEQNYPNPFRFKTNIEYTIPPMQSRTGFKAGTVRAAMRIYDSTGGLHSLVFDKEHRPGKYEILFDGLSPGIYTYVLSVANHAISRKMTIVK